MRFLFLTRFGFLCDWIFLARFEVVSVRLAVQDNDQTISSDELKEVMEAMGKTPTDAEVEELIQKVDTSGNGRIEFGEFVEMMADYSLSDTVHNSEMLMDLFKSFDADNSGFVNKDELRQAMESFGEKMSPEEIEEMIQIADFNGDGLMDYAEFVRMMQQK